MNQIIFIRFHPNNNFFFQERSSKSKAMNDIQKIQKESQRMMRESHVAIPYHRPRQRTLAEFRARRMLAPSVPLRTSADKLVTIW